MIFSCLFLYHNKNMPSTSQNTNHLRSLGGGLDDASIILMIQKRAHSPDF